jgi:hypothetical protein
MCRLRNRASPPESQDCLRREGFEAPDSADATALTIRLGSEGERPLRFLPEGVDGLGTPWIVLHAGIPKRSLRADQSSVIPVSMAGPGRAENRS